MYRFSLNKPSFVSLEEMNLILLENYYSELGQFAWEASWSSGPSGNREMAILIKFPLLKTIMVETQV